MSREQCIRYVRRWLEGKGVKEETFKEAIELLLELHMSDRTTIGGLKLTIKNLQSKLKTK